MTTEEKIHKQLAENPIILYMKGVPDHPECGFSAKAVACLAATGLSYSFVNVLAAPFIREKLPKISKWPTYPQLFVNGELIGGCDIIEAMAEDGSLITALQQAKISEPTPPDPSVVSSHEVEQLIRSVYSDAKIFIEGAGCDLTITVVSDRFEGLSLVKKHQAVMETLTDPLASGRLHAVTLKTFTCSEWQNQHENNANGLLQIQS